MIRQRRRRRLFLQIATGVCISSAIFFEGKRFIYATDPSIYFEVATFSLLLTLVFLLIKVVYERP
jgi:hypothetical protein